MNNLDHVEKLRSTIPQELQQLNQWVVWRLEKTEGGKTTKVPYQVKNPTAHASSTNKITWGSFDDAVALLKKAEDISGIGFVFDQEGDYVGIDLDHVRDDGMLTPETWHLIESVGSYTEISPSGTGVHIIAKIDKSQLKFTGGFKGNGVEVYSNARYFTVTGNTEELFGDEPYTEIKDATTVVQELVRRSNQSSGSGEYREEGNFEELLNAHAQEGSRYEMSARVAGSLLARIHPSLWDSIAKPMYLKWCDTHTTPSLLKEDPQEVAKTWENIKKRHIANHPMAFNSTPTITTPSQPEDKEEIIDSVSEFSDLKNALRIIRDYGDEFKFSNHGSTGEWVRWDGKRWTNDLTVIDFFTQKLSVSLRTEYAPEMAKLIETLKEDVLAKTKDEKRSEQIRLDKIRKFIISSESASKIRALPALLRPRLSIDGNIFDSDPDRLTVANGILNLQTLQLESFNPNRFLTRLVPTPFIADASCPKWEQFMYDVCCGDEQLVLYLQKLFGYCLTGSTREQKMWFFYGPTSGNGKSTLMTVVKKVLGNDIADVAPQKLLLESRYEEHPTLVMDVKGRRIIDISETPQKGKLNVNLLKQLTGGDQIKARSMRQDYTTFRPSAKFIFVTNYPPTIDDMTKAVWRRVRVVPFNASFLGSGEILEYDAQLIKEREGILKWMVDGLALYRKEGLKDVDAVKQATASYQQKSDTVAPFVRAWCAFGNDNKVAFVDLYAQYEKWCVEIGTEPVGKILFIDELQRVIYPNVISDQRVGHDRVRVIMGISLAA